MNKRIAGAIGVAALAGAILVSCSSSTSASGDGYKIENGNEYVYTTTVKVGGKIVNCVIVNNLSGIDCDWAGATEVLQ